MQHFDTAVTGLAVVALAMTLLWLVSLRLRDASIVDPFWAPGFLLACVTIPATRPCGHRTEAGFPW